MCVCVFICVYVSMYMNRYISIDHPVASGGNPDS